MAVVLEHDVGELDDAVALDVHLIEAVDQNVRDRLIAQQHLERSQPEQLVEHVARQRFAFGQRQRRVLGLALEHRHDEPADFRLGVFALDVGEPIEIEPIEQAVVHPALEILIVRTPRVGR